MNGDAIHHGPTDKQRQRRLKLPPCKPRERDVMRPRVYAEVPECGTFLRKMGTRVVAMVKAPCTPHLAIMERDVPKALAGDAVQHYRVPPDELLLD